MADDRSLLDRLNALKPSGVTLDRSFQTTSAAPHVTSAAAAAAATSTGSAGVAADAPVSRADALAARLRLLRHQGESTITSTDEPRRKHIATASADPPPALPPTALSAVHSHGYGDGYGDGDDNDDGDDPLLFSDEQALSSFLMEGEEEEVEEDDEDDHDDDSFVLLPDVPSRSRLDQDDEVEDADDEKKVADLLQSLGGPFRTGKEDGGPSHDADDGSDGDDMDREVRRVLSQARDEADWAARQHGADSDSDSVGEERQEAGGGDADEPKEVDETSPKRPEDTTSTRGGHPDDDADSLRLPAVPTKLVDPPAEPRSGGCDPADDIAVRLAALRGLSGRESGLGQTDAFGLPSAPTFQPGEWPQQQQQKRRHHHGSSPSLAHGRVGYTDADQRSWCVVCLEDAAVRCLGCDDDPYCARCWREMHVGPAAGFDERGHKRVPLRRPG